MALLDGKIVLITGASTGIGHAAAVGAARHGADIRFGAGPDPIDNLQGPHTIERAARELGFTPSISLAQGIEDHTRWISQRRIR